MIATNMIHTEIVEAYRQTVVALLKARGPQQVRVIYRRCRIDAQYLNEVLDHKWFCQTMRGVALTEEGQKAND